MRGIRLKWRELRRLEARWRGYDLAAYSTGQFFGYSIKPPRMITDYGAGFPTIEAAMTAAEMAARAHFEKTRKRRK